MPKTSVDECPAGIAMDTAVAEALGWSQIHSIDNEYYNGFFSSNLFGLPPMGHPRREGCDRVGTRVGIPPFSTDISAAWGLAETFRHGRFFVGWSEDWGVPYCRMGDAHEYAETIPLVICRAFLKANGVTEIETPE